MSLGERVEASLARLLHERLHSIFSQFEDAEDRTGSYKNRVDSKIKTAPHGKRVLARSG